MTLVHALQAGQLALVVNAFHLDRIIHQTSEYRDVMIVSNLHQIRQVVLALGIVIADLGQPRQQIEGIHQHDAGIHFLNLANLVASILFLNDFPDGTAVIPNNAAIAFRIIQLDRQYTGLAQVHRIEESIQRSVADQGNIAVQHQGAAAFLQLWHCLFDCMASAQLLALLHPFNGFAGKLFGDNIAHLLTTMAIHHDDTARVEAETGIQYMGQQGFLCQRLQNLGQAGLHAGAFTRREDDDVKIHTG